MDIGKLSHILLALGGVTTFGALIWWAHFYKEVTRGTGASLGDALQCLWSSGGPCGFISGLARWGGVTPYTPVLFWVGGLALVCGTVLKLALIKGDQQAGGDPSDSTFPTTITFDPETGLPSKSSLAGKLFCGKCGQRLNGADKFCSKCGTEVT